MKITTVAAAAMLSALSFSLPALAQEKPALTPGIVEQLDLASKLTNYGVERNDPLLLLAAARLMTTVGPQAAASAPAMSAEDLIAKAKSLAGDDADIGALADAIAAESARGLCYGSGTVYGCF